MAIDTGRSSRLLSEALSYGRAVARRASHLWAAGAPVVADRAGRMIRFVGRLPPVRWFSRSLPRRILLSNLLGLLILLGGSLYMNQYKEWLVDAKVDSLSAQGEIIAQALASNAQVMGNVLVVDPDSLPESNASLAPYRDDGFAALSLSLAPERVTPVLSRLLQPEIRARIFDSDGKLVVDSRDFLSRGRFIGAKQQPDPDKIRTKNLWTKLTEYLFTSDIPVLKELDQANGQYYPPVRTAMTGTGTPMLLLNENGQQIVSYAAPIRRFRQIHGVLLLSTDPGEIDKVLTKERNAIIRLAILALGATIATSLLLAYSVAGPIRRLAAAADNVSRDINSRHQLPNFAHRQDEVGLLAQSFAAMTNSLYRRIEASEKFAADVAHELKNPLTAARSTAESLSYAKTPEQRDQLVQQIQDELKRLNRLITDVSNASRLEANLAREGREVIDLEMELSNIVGAFRDMLSDNTRTVRMAAIVGPPGRLCVYAHEGRIGQVVTNLIDNAVSFSPENATVTLTARRDGDMVEFAVEDEGPGIEPDMLEPIFKRFYTYRPTAESSRGNNSGLGLSISREIIEAHDGRIWAENRYSPGAASDAKPLGARFVVRLPAAEVRSGAGRAGSRRSRRG